MCEFRWPCAPGVGAGDLKTCILTKGKMQADSGVFANGHMQVCACVCARSRTFQRVSRSIWSCNVWNLASSFQVFVEVGGECQVFVQFDCFDSVLDK